MGLASRTAHAQHATQGVVATAGVDPSIYWDFQVSQRVMTVDGFPGVVASVEDGPIAGTETYIVMLANDMGGGEYTASQLTAISDSLGSVHRTAAEDYPELGDVLERRPDIARNTVMGSKTAAKTPSWAAGQIACDECDERHPAEYSHEGKFGQGPIYSVICPKDGKNLTDYYTAERLETHHPKEKPLGLSDYSAKTAVEQHKVTVIKRPSRSGGLYQADCKTCDYSGQVAPMEVARSQAEDHRQGKAHVQASLATQADHDHHDSVHDIVSCPQCRNKIDHLTEPDPDEECQDEYCQENKFPEGWHTGGEHIDPPHRDPGHPDYHAAEQAVHDAFGGQDHSWLLDQQHTGPSKYSAREGLTHHHVPASEVQQGDYLDANGKTRVHNLMTRGDGDDAQTTLAWKVRGSGAPGVSGHKPDALVHVWRRGKTAAHETVDGTECQEGGEPDLDGNGHLTWGGHTPVADTDAYSMFGSPDVSKQSSADPYAMLALARADSDFAFHVTAAWSDVRNKAKRIRAEGGVHLTLVTEGMIVGEVKGEHHVYETGLQRMPGREAIHTWSCGCKWGAYHWGAADDSSRFAGRMCSHALALQYEAQSRGMFGRQVSVDDHKPTWAPRKVVVKYDIDDRRNVSAPATTRPGDYARIASLSPLAVLAIQGVREGDDVAEIALAFKASGFNLASIDITSALRTMAVGQDGGTYPCWSTPGGHTKKDGEHAPHDYVPTAGWVAHCPGRQVTQAAVNNAWGEPAPKYNPPQPGPTMPRDPNANPASTGWASAADPDNWSQVIPSDNVGQMNSSKHATNDEARDWNLPDSERDDETISGEAGLNADMEARIALALATPEETYRESRLDGTVADLDDEPEGALPTTDGVDLSPQSPDSLEPEDESFVSTGSVDDIVAQFQATAGARMLANGGPSRGGGGTPQSASNGDLAAAAKAFLAKEAVKTFSPAEQHAIISEGEREGARAGNHDRLDITGTQYEPLEAALAAADDDEHLSGWLA